MLLVSIAVFLPALLVPRSGDDLTVRKLILFASLAALLISGIWFLIRWEESKRLMRLRRGEGVLARWTIDRARWEWFRGLSNEWDQRKDLRPNDANLAQDPGDAGIEIVVTRDAILIGEQFVPVEKDVRITTRADWMEFYQIIHKPKGPALHIVLRVPLPAGKQSVAAEIQQSYIEALRTSGLDRRVLIYILLLAFVGLPAVTALIWFIAKLTGWVS